MSINYPNLVAQGRAKAIGVPWSPEELEALLRLENERGIGRLLAADYIRNGITTVEDYDKAKGVNFVPKTAEQAAEESEQALKENGPKSIASVKVGKASTGNKPK